ncbi:MAG: hypothetical protein LBU16_07315 [Treponema sp.]|jgi:hypothetical protein|nr:hypothetical protein [Treponema sp.]
MRLRDIYDIIVRETKVIESIKLVYSATANNGIARNIYTISNIDNAFSAFENLSKIDSFKEDVNRLLAAYPFLRTIEDTLYLDQVSFNSIKSEIENIEYKCNALKQVLVQIIEKQNENTISFKLYDFDNFDEYTKFCDDLNTKILLPIKRLNIDIQLGDLESGTKWLSIIVGATAGVALFMSIVRQSFDILVHDYQKYKVATNVVESLGLGEEIIKAYNKNLLERIKNETHTRTETVLQDISEFEETKALDKNALSELNNAISISMELLSQHIDKGLEVYQALDVDEANRYKLPDYKELLTAKEPVKLLGNKAKIYEMYQP